MEKEQKKSDQRIRHLLKNCFSNVNPFILLSFIPFEIWKHIMLRVANLKSIVSLSQTCQGFKELFEILQENEVSIATRLIKKGQISLGK